ncbi:glycosyltransferase [Candidatus Viridilinea mediisalina]|uniref:Glycosyl transferase family 1 n=1 Tax=Candidatus Viridilinea mediisalina TaxID=2024553 RepID=A0A2A6RKQ1_9CHLR|nr:glycosyltransferase [Candidatus Viridilinea mediisalina]PDW03466.1 glycosyl transferase family 1 [Candidatus Viridilinea mediisalina]
MRVAMISVHSSPLATLGGKEAGGMNVYVRELARELGGRGIPVDIFTRTQQRSLPTIQPIACGVRVINLHAGPAAPYDKNWILTYLPEFVNRVRCFADGEDIAYDVIHSHYWLSGEAALRLRRSWDTPVVHMFHTLGAMKNSVARSKEETESSVRIALERRLMHEVDAVVAATPLDRAQMVWNYGADAEWIRVIPCGVDLNRFQPMDQALARARLDLPTNERLLLCVGRMEPLKGMDALIRALALLQANEQPWAAQLKVLLVGGEPEDRPHAWNSEQRRLDALRRELGVAERVRFVGAQGQDLLPAYFAAAAVVAVPSHYESFGMVALEAMAAGAAVVASKAGGLALTIEDGRSGLLFPVDDHQALAHLLAHLLDHPDEAARLRDAARARAAEFGWGTIARRISGLYAEQIDLRRAARTARRPTAQVS